MGHAFSCDLDLDPVTFIYELDLEILELYLRTKNELSRVKAFKSYSTIDRQTAVTERIITAAFASAKNVNIIV